MRGARPVTHSTIDLDDEGLAASGEHRMLMPRTPHIEGRGHRPSPERAVLAAGNLD